MVQGQNSTQRCLSENQCCQQRQRSATSWRPFGKDGLKLHTHTHFITPGGGAERAANAVLLIHFSRYVLVSLKPIQSKSSLRFTVPFACYIFADSRVLVMSAAWLEGHSSSVQHPILG